MDVLTIYHKVLTTISPEPLKQFVLFERNIALVGYTHIATDKRGYPHNIFLISPQKHMLWYSLKVPR